MERKTFMKAGAVTARLWLYLVEPLGTCVGLLLDVADAQNREERREKEKGDKEVIEKEKKQTLYTFNKLKAF